jgi:hypothetical protein
LDKFRESDGNWRVSNQRLEEGIQKVEFGCSLQEEETERSKLRVEGDGNGSRELWREKE